MRVLRLSGIRGYPAAVFAAAAITSIWLASAEEPKDGRSLSHPETHVFVEVEGVPFLIPKAYFSNPRRAMDGPAPELGLHAELPDVIDNGAEAEQAVGFADHLRIGVFPPELYTEMEEGNLYTEQVPSNLLNQREFVLKQQGRPERAAEMRAHWATFVEKYRHRERELLNVDLLLSRIVIGTPAQALRNEYYVGFLDGRLVLYVSCSKPRPKGNPSCWVNYHRPGDRFALRLIFGRSYESDVFTIAERVRARLAQFEADGRALIHTKSTRTQGDPR